MRTIILAVALMSICACTLAQESYPPTPPGSRASRSPDEVVQFKAGKVTMAMQDAPMASALDQLFKGAGKPYSLDHATSIGFQSSVTLRMENATFEQALDALMHAAGLKYKIDNGTYMLSPKPTAMGMGGYGGSQQRRPQPVYLTLNAMPVKQAYDAVIKASGAPDDLGWQFKGDLGNTIMRGASFRYMPVEMAAAMVVVAAGLVPPSSPNATVTSKGNVDISPLFPSVPMLGVSSVASYKGRDNVWRYLINARSYVPDMLMAIFPANSNYIIRDQEQSKGVGPVASVRLMNVTLEEALDAILGPTGYTCRKQNGVYMIRQGAGAAATTTTHPSRKRTAASSRARPKP